MNPLTKSGAIEERHVRTRNDQAGPAVPYLRIDFRNEPLTDFSRAEARQAMTGRARSRSAGSSARPIRSVIDGRKVATPKTHRFGQSIAPAADRRPVRPGDGGPGDAGRRGGARPRSRRGATPTPAKRAEYLFDAAAGDAAAAFRAGGLAGLRVRQAVARGRRRRGRGHRLLRLLRPRNAATGRAAAARRARRGERLLLRAARRRRGHRAVELPAGHPVRHDHGRPGHRQHGHHEAGRAVVGDRRQADGGLPGGRPAARRRQLSCPASARRSARRWSSIPTWP